MTNLSTYYLYFLECSNGSIYTGQTTNIERRLKQHWQGHQSCKYTRSFPPKNVLQVYSFTSTKGDCLRVEYAIKQLTKSKKMALIESQESFLYFVESQDIELTSIQDMIHSKVFQNTIKLV